MLVEFDYLITPDGEIYNLEDMKDRSIIGSITGQGMPPIEYQTQRGPQQHGSTVIGYRLEPRVMTLVHRRNGCDRQDYWDNRFDLVDVLRPNRMTTGSKPLPCTLRKVLPDMSIWDIDVLIEQGPNFEASGSEWDEWAFQEALRFVAHDPTFYDPASVSILSAIPANTELTFPASFPISFGESSATVLTPHVYAGTWLAYPVITLTGPLSAVVISNLTTGEEITFTRERSAGQQAVIDTRFGKKTAVDPALDPDDPDYNLIGSVSGDLGTFHLEPAPAAPGGLNQIQVYIWALDTTGSVAIEYNTRYMGL